MRLTSYVIRHGRTVRSWDTLGYTELTRLLRLEDDPPPNMRYLIDSLDAELVRGLGIHMVYTSPLRRALETAKYISRLAGVGLKVLPSLVEVRFDGIPRETYDKGKRSMRVYLVGESLSTPRKVDLSAIGDGALLVTHGFLMRHIYSGLFGVPVRSLSSSPIFTTYLSGFEMQSGNGVSLLKAAALRG